MHIVTGKVLIINDYFFMISVSLYTNIENYLSNYFL